MKRFWPLSFAAVSAAVCVLAVEAARPRYGGTLRLDAAIPLRAFDLSTPADGTVDRLRPLVFEPLVTPRPDGTLRGLLAVSWETDARSIRWRFTLRRGVTLHDGSSLTPQDVASALAGDQWTVTAEADAISIVASRPMPDLLWDLADSSRAIVVRRGAAAVGSGPFLQTPSRPAVLRAYDAYWGGRPFLDEVRIETGRPPADQLTDLEFGRAHLVSVAASDARRLTQRGFRVAASKPIDLVALAFQPNHAGAADERLRHAVSAAIDRRAIADALLQRLAEPAVTLLPGWLTGYTRLFPIPPNLRSDARGIVAALPAPKRSLVLRYDAADALIRALAERLVADARESGLTMALDPAQPPSLRPIDLRLMRVKLDTASPDRAMSRLLAAVPIQVRRLLPSPPDASGSLEAMLRFERALVEQELLIPLVHVPEIYGIGANVELGGDGLVLPSFALDLANVWLRGPRP